MIKNRPIKCDLVALVCSSSLDNDFVDYDANESNNSNQRRNSGNIVDYDRTLDQAEWNNSNNLMVLDMDRIESKGENENLINHRGKQQENRTHKKKSIQIYLLIKLVAFNINKTSHDCTNITLR